MTWRNRPEDAALNTLKSAPRRDIVVVGASAGGLQPLQTLLAAFPPDFGAAVFVVLHIGASSHLVRVLGHVSTLPVLAAESGQTIRPGHVYVGVPGVHLLLHDHHVLLRRGPRENMARPAIDPLFRTAACSFGARVIGVVLSGALSDGTAGLSAIKRCGGVAIVQDPNEAAVPDMPASACARVAVDRVLPVAAMAEALRELTEQPAGPTPTIPDDIKLEAAIAAQELAGMDVENTLGKVSRFTCPECHGALWEMDDNTVLRFRCHVGHAYTADTMLDAHQSVAEELLWNLLRSYRERASLARQMSERQDSGIGRGLTEELQRRARDYDEDAAVVKELLDSMPGFVASAGEDPSSRDG